MISQTGYIAKVLKLYRREQTKAENILRKFSENLKKQVINENLEVENIRREIDVKRISSTTAARVHSGTEDSICDAGRFYQQSVKVIGI